MVLQGGTPSVVGSDYINANYISGEVAGSEKHYIATQGCLPTTVVDFWRMMWQENAQIIVMTTNEVERGRVRLDVIIILSLNPSYSTLMNVFLLLFLFCLSSSLLCHPPPSLPLFLPLLPHSSQNKCARYWPGINETGDYGSITVQNASECINPHYIYREFIIHHVDDVSVHIHLIYYLISTCNCTCNCMYIIFTDILFLTLSLSSFFSSSSLSLFLLFQPSSQREVFHYHFKAWPDHGVPQDPGTVLSFLQDINSKQDELVLNNCQPGPLIVHCSAGIGRTGTFIVIDIILNVMTQQGGCGWWVWLLD